MKVNEAIAIARAEVGTTEYPPNSNKTVYGEWYGLNGQPWCCIFQQWVFRDTNLLKKTASCSDLLNWFKSQGQFFDKPQTGDLVFYNFHTPNKPSDHIGIVEAVNINGSIWAIEGNTSSNNKGSQDNGGGVFRRQRASNIVGYGRPKYSDAVIPVPSIHPTLKVGSKGSDVVCLHKLLKGLGYGVDINVSIYNQLTKQCVMHVQASNMLEIDGICGPLTWAVLEK